MAVQHSNIADANRHENKGASTATAGQVLQGDGDGTTSFVNPSTLQNITIGSVLESQSLVSQGPTALDTLHQVAFAAASSNSDVSIATNGTVTLTTAGLYSITFNLNFGRTTNTGIAIMFARLLVNDVPTGFVQGVKVDTSVNVTPFNATILRKFNANDTVKIQLIRDSGGTNDGGLITLDPVLAGWANSPSAAIRVQKIAGGF